MGGLSPLHWVIVLAVVLLLFGGGSKISNMMGDLAKGIKSFRKNLADDETPPDPQKVSSARLSSEDRRADESFVSDPARDKDRQDVPRG